MGWNKQAVLLGTVDGLDSTIFIFHSPVILRSRYQHPFFTDGRTHLEKLNHLPKAIFKFAL